MDANRRIAEIARNAQQIDEFSGLRGSTPAKAPAAPVAPVAAPAPAIAFPDIPSQPAYSTQPPFGTSQPAYNTQPSFGTSQPSFGTSQPSFGTSQPAYNTQPSFGTSQPAYNTQPSFGTSQPAYNTQPSFGTSQPAYNTQPSFGSTQPAYGAQPAYGGAGANGRYGMGARPGLARDGTQGLPYAYALLTLACPCLTGGWACLALQYQYSGGSGSGSGSAWNMGPISAALPAAGAGAQSRPSSQGSQPGGKPTMFDKHKDLVNLDSLLTPGAGSQGTAGKAGTGYTPMNPFGINSGGQAAKQNPFTQNQAGSGVPLNQACRASCTAATAVHIRWVWRLI
jgi:hypothetical protein